MITKEAIIAKLRNHTIKVQFTKTDGSDRTMTCTLQEKLIPTPKEADPSKKTKKVNESSVVVWDLEKQAFRSFKIDSLKEWEIA